jgi:hypothetical protein
MYYTGKECDVLPYTEAYEAIKSVPIVEAATAYDHTDTGETTILSLNEAIWMGDQMEHTLINPNQLRAYGITVQDNPFDPAPIFISTEDNESTLPLNSKGTVLGVATITPADQELQTCPHVVLSSEHEWDPKNVWFPRAARTVEEEISRTVGAVMTQDGASTEDPDNDAMDCVFDIGNMSKRLVASVKVASPPRQISQVETEAQDLPPIKTFQSKGRHLSVSPEDLSEQWQIALEQSKETLKWTTQRVIQSAVIPLARRYHADRMFQTKRLAGKWVSNTMVGRVDILLETSLLSSYLAMPRVRHLEQAFHIFGYSKTHPKRKIGFDLFHPEINENRFQKCDWEEFYRDAEEAIPENKPEPRGKSMSTHCFVDANHAGDTETRRSQIGILLFCYLFCYKAPTMWFSKRQSSVEASTFGSEFTAMKNAVEIIEALRYKL